MAKAAVDMLALLAVPALKANAGCADLLGDQLFAYGSGASIVVAEVFQLAVQAVLHGEHRDTVVTAVKWAPDCHARDLKSTSHLRLASGDAEGRVVVWDVLSHSALAHLPARLLDGSSPASRAAAGSVAGLQWVLSQPCLLAVLHSQGSLLLWDARGGSVIWQRDLMSGESCCCMARDPLNAQRLAICGSAGGLAVIALTDPQAGQVEVTQYRVSLGNGNNGAATQQQAAGSSPALPGPGFQALFSPARDLLFLTLPREVLVFDLELGIPATSLSLPSSRPSFAFLLGVYGRGVTHGLGDEGGADVIYAAHHEGALSVWARNPGELKFSVVGWFRLTPPAVKGSAVNCSLLTAQAQVWPSRCSQYQPPQFGGQEDVTSQLRATLLPDRVTADASGARDIMGGLTGRATKVSAAGSRGSSSGGSTPQLLQKVSIVSVTADGRLWHWAATLPTFPAPLSRLPAGSPTHAVRAQAGMAGTTGTQPASAPVLTAMQQLLPHPVTCAAMFPVPVLVNRQKDSSPAMVSSQLSNDYCVVTLMGAALTTQGQLQIFTLQQGHIAPLSMKVALSLQIHKEGNVARGLRWLGSTPRVVSFACERLPAQGGGGGSMWRNFVAITDLRNRRSTPFREISSEPHRLIAVRVSPSGFHVLLRFHDAPSELWAVGVDPPLKLVSLDVDWSAPEWLHTNDPTQPTPVYLSDLLDALPVPGAKKLYYDTPMMKRAEGTQEQTGGSMKEDASAELVSNPRSSSSGVSLSISLPNDGDENSQKQMPTPVGGWAATPMSIRTPTTRHVTNSKGTQPPSNQPATTEMDGGAREGAAEQPAGLQLPFKQPSNPWQESVNAATAAAPEELLVYTYDEGNKSGVLRVRGRSIASHEKIKRPRMLGDEPARFQATAMAGWGSLVVMGDQEGRLALWNTTTGAVNLIHTGCGVIRRLAVSPAPHTQLYATNNEALTIVARIACLFGDGTFGIYELGPLGQLRAGHCSPIITSRAVGRITDLSWVPWPCEGGGGSVLLVVNDNGSLAVLDVAQAADKRPSLAARMSTVRGVLGKPCLIQAAPPVVKESSPSMDLLGDEVPMTGAGQNTSTPTIVLLPPAPLSSGLLLPRPWLLLLRLLLHLGTSVKTLRVLAGLPTNDRGGNATHTDVADAVEDVLTLFPNPTHKALLHSLSGPQTSSWQHQSLSVSATTTTSQQQQQQPLITSMGGFSNDQAAPNSSNNKDTSQLAARPSYIDSAVDITQQQGTSTIPGHLEDSSNMPDASVMGTSPMSLMKAMSEAIKTIKSTTQGLMATAADMVTTPEGPAAAGRAIFADGGVVNTPAVYNARPSRFQTDFVGLLKHLARTRANGQLLFPAEWQEYEAALGQGQPHSTSSRAAGVRHSHAGGRPQPLSGTAARVARVSACMEVAAKIAGDTEEARFWQHLPHTLQAVRDLQDKLAPQHTTNLYTALQQGSHSCGGSGGSIGYQPTPGRALPEHVPEHPPPVRIPQASSMSAGMHNGTGATTATGSSQGEAHTDSYNNHRNTSQLWDEQVTLSEAMERALWHESLSQRVQAGQQLQERRMLEYVVLGDFQTAVAFLLASPPEPTARYYRDALVTAALAAAANVKPGAGSRNLGSTLQLQAAKVLSAHAASIGDPLLGVPLHCAAGLYTEAVTLLQECGSWRYAANLIAHALTAAERGAALQRWAQHIASNEGSLWRAVGVLVAGGCCREALQLLKSSGRPDCAAAFLAACHQAGLTQILTRKPGPTMPAATDADHGQAQLGGQQQTPLSPSREAVHSSLYQRRLSMSKGDMLLRQSSLKSRGSLEGPVASLPSETDDILPSSWTYTRVFSVLTALGADNTAAPDMNDDALPVQLQFEHYINDLLRQM